MAVAPAGRLMTSPRGVKANTSSGSRSLLMSLSKSVASALERWLSSSWRTQARRSSSLSLPPVMPALYFQCAAMPYSAMRSMSQVRICTSNGMASRPMTVVCKDW